MSDHDTRYVAWHHGVKALLADEDALGRWAQARGLTDAAVWRLDDEHETIRSVRITREGDEWRLVDGSSYLTFAADPSDDPLVLHIVDDFCRPVGGGREWEIMRWTPVGWPPALGSAASITGTPHAEPELIERYARYGYLPPYGSDGVVHLCPERVARTCEGLDDADLESYLSTIGVRISMFARFPYIDDVAQLERICDNAIYDLSPRIPRLLAHIDDAARAVEGW